MALRYVATGMGHSGTGYVSRLLQSAGVRCGHGSVFSADGVLYGTDLDADSSFAAAAYLRRSICKKAVVIHVVRNPVDVVKSYLRSGWDIHNETWVRKTLAVKDQYGDMPYDALGWVCNAWVRWNLLIESHGADHVFMVEDGPANLKKLGLKQVVYWDNRTHNKHPSSDLAIKHESVRRRCREAKHYSEIDWLDLPLEMRNAARRYGYTWT